MADVLDKKLSEILDIKLASFKAEIETTIEENIDKAFASQDLEKKDQQRSKAIDDLEQHGRRSMVEVSGIPRLQNENCEALIIEIGKKIGIEIKHDDIEASHRNSRKEDACYHH
eukprot:gene7640-8482_t